MHDLCWKCMNYKVNSSFISFTMPHLTSFADRACCKSISAFLSEIGLQFLQYNIFYLHICISFHINDIAFTFTCGRFPYKLSCCHFYMGFHINDYISFHINDFAFIPNYILSSFIIFAPTIFLLFSSFIN